MSLYVYSLRNCASKNWGNAKIAIPIAKKQYKSLVRIKTKRIKTILERYFWRFLHCCASFSVKLKEFFFHEAEHSCNDICRKALHSSIHISHISVVESAGCLNLVLCVSQLSLQFKEVRGSFQIRIVLC